MRKLILLTGILFPFLIFSQEKMEYKINGFVDTYHAIRSKEPNDFMSSRSRLRTEFRAEKGSSSLFTSINAVHNAIIPEETRLELREAFFLYSNQNWDIKMGRQIIIWGVSDGLRITDLVSPMEMTEFLARDYDDIRIPVTAIRGRYFNQWIKLELIYIPVSSYFILPTQKNNPWNFFPQYEGLQTIYFSDNTPLATFENGEYGFRSSFFLNNMDFGISMLHTWNKMPVLERNLTPNHDSLLIYPHYNRMDMLGADFSASAGQFVFRGEYALYIGELQSLEGEYSDIKRNTSNFLVGIDWYPGYDWTISAQYSHKLIPDYLDQMENKSNTIISTLSITKKLLRNLLNISTFSYIDITNNSFFNRSSIDYSLSDEIKIFLGYDWFHGDKGMFGFYKNNSEVWIKGKFTF